jgi:hypothetical protein
MIIQGAKAQPKRFRGIARISEEEITGNSENAHDRDKTESLAPTPLPRLFVIGAGGAYK